MKKLFTTFLLLVAFNATAEMEERVQRIKCFPLDDLRSYLIKWKEEPVFIMDIMMYNGNGELQPYETIFTINSKTRRWSLIRQADETTACIQGAGDNFNFINLDKPNAGV